MRSSVLACVAWLYPICAVVGVYPPNGQIPLMPAGEWSADRLVKVLHPTEQHRQLLPKLESAGLDIWKSTTEHSMIRLASFDGLGYILASKLEHETVHTNLTQLVHDQIQPNVDGDLHSMYHTLSSIESILRLFSSDYPSYTQTFQIATSAQGRPVNAIKVSDYTSSTAKLEFVILGGSHAREWISPASILYSIHSLLLTLDGDASKDVRKLLQRVEFTFVPTINPDGYVYTFEHDRFWRKNRQDVGQGCFGIDLNRQWDYKWHAPLHQNPCLDSYPGSHAFEATELQGLSTYLSNHSVAAFVDAHSFGQLLMYPYAHSCDEHAKDEENLFEVALGAAKAAKKVAGKVYETGAVCDLSYSSSGDSVDWVYAVAGVRWSFSLELRDLGLHGFLLPPSQIRPTGQEMLEMLLSVAGFVVAKEG